MSRSAGRKSDRAWRLLAEQVYRDERDCWLCGGYVDQRLDYRHPMSRTADHLVQIQHGGPEHDRGNVRLAHMAHNTARSNALRGLAKEDCACSVGRPCDVLVPSQKRGYVALEPGAV
jgi:hypothetical protein